MKHMVSRVKQPAFWMLVAIVCLSQSALINAGAVSTSNREKPRGEAHQSKAAGLESLTNADEATRLKAGRAYDLSPLVFEENRGQADARVKFISRGAGFALLLTETEATLKLNAAPRLQTSETCGCSSPGAQKDETGNQSAVLRMKLAGASPAPRVYGFGETRGKSNYFIGNDPNNWRANIPAYANVKYEQVYPGVDVVYYGDRRQIEYDFNLAPGADFRAIRLAFEGAHQVRVDPGGDLVLETAAGEVRHRRPVAYQVSSRGRVEISARYVINKNREVSFELGRYDASKPLVIDPVVSYSTYLGGSGEDEISAVAVDSSGNVYLTGRTVSTDFPTTAGAFQTTRSRGPHAFVSKLNLASNTLVYSTYLGGQTSLRSTSPLSIATAIALDSRGNAYITGRTLATDFPTTAGAFQTAWRGTANFLTPFNAFVTKLNQDGSALVYSTYLGGSLVLNTISGRSSDNSANAIAVDSFDNAYVAGSTNTLDFPTTANAFQQAKTGELCSGLIDSTAPCNEGFVTKLNQSGTALVYSTYLGGNGNDVCNGISVDSAGNAHVVGTTDAAFAIGRKAFPTANPIQPSSGGGSDAFVAKLNVAGTALVYSTYLGGSGDDSGSAIALDLSGNAYVTGTTNSTNLAVTPGAFQSVSGSSTLFKSTDGGLHWSASSGGPPSDFYVALLAVAPMDSSTVHAGVFIHVSGGVFRSTDGGSTWSGDLMHDIFGGSIRFLAFDPQNPLISYVSIIRNNPFSSDFLKSEDGGRTWQRLFLPLPFTNATVVSVAVDPTSSSILYASAFSSLIKSENGGRNWKAIGKGFPDGKIFAIDPSNPSTLFAGINRLYKSANGGRKWKPTNLFDQSLQTVAVDPLNPSRVYAGGSGVYRSADGGENWKKSNGLSAQVLQLVVDPVTPSTIYAATTSGVFKSVDRGKNWAAINAGLPATNYIVLAIDPKNPSTLYAGSDPRGSDIFVAKLNQSGSAFSYLTYLGGGNYDLATSIAADEAGNAYVTGITSSRDFPTKNPVQPVQQIGQNSHPFLTKLAPTGTDLDYSTHLGGITSGEAKGVAVDFVGGAYVVGITYSSDLIITPDGFQKVARGAGDGFLIKVDPTGPVSINSALHFGSASRRSTR